MGKNKALQAAPPSSVATQSQSKRWDFWFLTTPEPFQMKPKELQEIVGGEAAGLTGPHIYWGNSHWAAPGWWLQ